MEPLWSPAVATGRSRWQMGRPRKRLGQAQTVAVGCDRLPERFHGKEGVDGSSPSEGFSREGIPEIADLGQRDRRRATARTRAVLRLPGSRRTRAISCGARAGPFDVVLARPLATVAQAGHVGRIPRGPRGGCAQVARPELGRRRCNRRPGALLQPEWLEMKQRFHQFLLPFRLRSLSCMKPKRANSYANSCRIPRSSV
jgi:hypothetical protein